jgi:hypothetical protein
VACTWSLVTGRLDEAEDELTTAIADLEASGMGSRCVHPVTQLAELRVLQGRFEEARDLLKRYEDLPESVRPLAVLDLAIESPDTATTRLEQRIQQLGGLTVATFPLLTVLVDAQIDRGDLEAAGDAAAQLTVVAGLTNSKRHRAEALFATGKVAAAYSRDDAASVLRQAAKAFSEASLALQACRSLDGRLRFASGASETDDLLTQSVLAPDVDTRLPACGLLWPRGGDPAPCGIFVLSSRRDLTRLADCQVPHRRLARMWGVIWGATPGSLGAASEKHLVNTMIRAPGRTRTYDRQIRSQRATRPERAAERRLFAG